MRDDNPGQRPALKSKLLLGVAGLAAAAMSGNAAADPAPAASATTTADPPKWAPYIDVGGGVGEAMVQGRVDVFAPVSQDLDSLIFLNGGFSTSSDNRTSGTIGLGYRTKVDANWILGVYGAYDNTTTEFSHGFGQFSVGGEAMSEDWDARVNGYFANNNIDPIKNKFGLFITGTNIAIVQGQEAAYSGLDGEVGYRVFSTDNTDVRLFAGGFSFTRDGYRDISGPMGRAEVTVFDLDEIAPQSRLSLQGEITHDSVRHTDGFVGATLRIPLGTTSGSAAQTLDELDRRMVDPVRRNENVLTQWEYNKPEPVIIYGAHVSSQPTNTLLYVDNSAGAGTVGDPTTFADATKRGSANNAFIVGTTYEGAIKTGGAKIAAGETVVGGGETFTVKGVNSGQTFTHTFAPNSGKPSFTAGSAKQNVFNVSSYDSIYDVSISGPFKNGIFGRNVSNLNVNNVSIDGTGGGVNGIDLVENKSGTATINIDHVDVANVAGDGILISARLSSGTADQTIDLSYITTAHTGGSGIDVSAETHGGGSISQTIAITNASVDHTGYFSYGIAVDATADGGKVSQSVSVDPTTVTYAGGGLIIDAWAAGGGSASQIASVTGFSATYNDGDGILVYGVAHHGSVYQSATLDGVTVTGNLFNGVDVYGLAGKDGTVVQHLNANNVDAEKNGYCTYYYGCIGGNGLNVAGIASGSEAHPAVVAQYVNAQNSTFDNNAYAGVEAFAYAAGSGAAVRQDVEIFQSSMNGNGSPAHYISSYGAGVEGIGTAVNGASTQQYLLLGYDSVASNKADGAIMFATAVYDGFAQQSFVAYGAPGALAPFSHNKGEGVWLGSYAYYAGAVDQYAGIFFADMSHNKADGLKIVSNAISAIGGSYANYYSQIAQNVLTAFDTISHNHGDGVYIHNHTQFGGELDQYIEFYGDIIGHNHGNGIYEKSISSAYYAPGSNYLLLTGLYADFTVVGGSVNNNGGDGVRWTSLAYGPAYIRQHIAVIGTPVEYNVNGVNGLAYAAGYYSRDFQYIYVGGGAKLDHNSKAGAAFYSFQYYGPGPFGASIQEITLSSADFSHNGNSGVYGVAYAHGNQGRAQQNFVIGSSTFDYNGNDGLHLNRVAKNGVYVSGYDCSKVQGLYGGCAFVRQTVQIINSDFSHNKGNGIEIDTYASNLGAVYTNVGRPTEPTLLMEYVTADHNGQDGLYVANAVVGGSYLFQFDYALLSHFDHNSGDGITMYNLAAGYSLINATAAGGIDSHVPAIFLSYSTANNNKGTGLDVETIAAYTSLAYTYAITVNSHFDHNYSGFNSVAVAYNGAGVLQKALLYSYGAGYTGANDNTSVGAGFYTKQDATGVAVNIGYVAGGKGGIGQFDGNGYVGIGSSDVGGYNVLAVYGADVSGNNFGVGLRDAYGTQIALFADTTITNNNLGVGGQVTGAGATQIIELSYLNGDPTKPLGNTISGNGIPTLFIKGPGANQYIY